MSPTVCHMKIFPYLFPYMNLMLLGFFQEIPSIRICRKCKGLLAMLQWVINVCTHL